MSKASDAAKAKFEKDFKSGKMKVNAGEIISPGKIVAKLATKAAAKVAVKTTAKANARALKAAQGPSLAKGTKKLEAASGSVERAKVKMKAQDNMIAGDSKKAAYANAAKKTMTPSERMELAKKLAAKNKALANSAKGKTQTPTAEAARRRNINK